MSEAGNQTAAKRTIPIVVGAESEIGRREENQDSMTGFPSTFGSVYLIADGMGGHRGGAEASRMVVEGIKTHLLAAAAPEITLQQAIENAARATNRELFNKGKSGDPKYTGMGSTLSLVVIRDGNSGAELVTAHVGDSRVYLHRDGQLSPLTKDHTFVQRLVDSHAIDEEAARVHPEASVLTRAMGQAVDVVIDISEPILLYDGDGILLCSDGLSGYVPRAAIEDTVNRHLGPDDCVKALVKLALKSGSDDNITVQFVRAGNPPDIHLPPSSSNRITQPESNAMAAITQEQPTPAIRRSSKILMVWLAFGLLLLLGAAGLYKFRPALFSWIGAASTPEADPTTTLYGRVQTLHTKVTSERTMVQNELAAASDKFGPKHSLVKEMAQLEVNLDKLNRETDELGPQANDAQQKAKPQAGPANPSKPDKSKVVEGQLKTFTNDFTKWREEHKKLQDRARDLKIVAKP